MLSRWAARRGVTLFVFFLLSCEPSVSEIASLPWVNRERCLAPCELEPPQLVSVGRDGRVAARESSLRLRVEVQPALERWLSAARDAGFRVELSSGYRSYDEQERVFMSTFENGRAARPGHSEHQLGSAVDLRYDSSAAERWLAESAAQHGFVQSYPAGRQGVSGYPPEPWHFRFVGPRLAAQVARTGATLEELFRRYGSRVPAGDCQRCPSLLSREPTLASAP